MTLPNCPRFGHFLPKPAAPQTNASKIGMATLTYCTDKVVYTHVILLAMVGRWHAGHKPGLGASQGLQKVD